ncbi:hypothetical protein ACFQE5_06115 [Pseudonocardia hispaniensis]|uniref:Uncharacterized protein n=1 Tax=Pseudonocardia hispaniensis TaxID=904933 RepID=A0ABW1IZC1_9PSEU
MAETLGVPIGDVEARIVDGRAALPTTPTEKIHKCELRRSPG